MASVVPLIRVAEDHDLAENVLPSDGLRGKERLPISLRVWTQSGFLQVED